VRKINNIGDIDVSTPEGKLLITALSAMTVSPRLQIAGKTIDGTKTSPDAMLRKLKPIAKMLYPNFENEKTLPVMGAVFGIIGWLINREQRVVLGSGRGGPQVAPLLALFQEVHALPDPPKGWLKALKDVTGEDATPSSVPGK
jgi:hypothetical protein